MLVADPSLEYAFRTVDGVPQVLQGVRDEIRRGASQIKVMASGGVTSVNDPIDSVQFSPEELLAITTEAARWGKYVMAHVYAPEAHRARGQKRGAVLRAL